MAIYKSPRHTQKDETNSAFIYFKDSDGVGDWEGHSGKWKCMRKARTECKAAGPGNSNFSVPWRKWCWETGRKLEKMVETKELACAGYGSLERTGRSLVVQI